MDRVGKGCDGGGERAARLRRELKHHRRRVSSRLRTRKWQRIVRGLDAAVEFAKQNKKAARENGRYAASARFSEETTLGCGSGDVLRIVEFGQEAARIFDRI